MDFSTQLLHRSSFEEFPHGAFHAPIYTSVGFRYTTTQGLIDAFQGKGQGGYTYSRSGDPTASVLEEKITDMEGGVGSVVFSTGMAAISSFFLAFLKAGDHILASKFLFGNTISLFKTFERIGVGVEFVDVTDFSIVQAAAKVNTRFFFTETIANPGTQIPALGDIAAFCRERGIISLVDNTITTPYGFRPKELGFHFSMHSLSKRIAGHAGVLGGSITDLGELDWEANRSILSEYKASSGKLSALKQIRKKGLRDIGGTLSPFAANLIGMGAETLPLRLEKANKNAEYLASFLAGQSKVKRVYHPSLSEHLQHSRARKWFAFYGSMVSFELAQSCDVLRFADSLKLILRATHLGDNRTLILPVALTIFGELSVAERAAAGIGAGLMRLSVGVEAIDDLVSDLEIALKSC